MGINGLTMLVLEYYREYIKGDLTRVAHKFFGKGVEKKVY